MTRSFRALACVASCSFALSSAAAPPHLTTRLVASGFDFPVGIVSAPGDEEHLYVVEKNSAAVRVVNRITGVIELHNFLNLWGKTSPGGERGLLGLAFHPNYAQNGFAYVQYTDVNGDVVVERYRRIGSSGTVADDDSGEVLIREWKPFPQHNGGTLRFGLDGYLYISIGDGGSGFDPLEFAQSLDTLKGKILRIDVDHPTSGGPLYSIPPSNPFVGVPAARAEIYAYGLRNPWRFCIDRLTGDIFIGDVGQEQREEIDFIPAGVGGLNFGWRDLEGDLCTGLPGSNCASTNFAAPIHTYTHDSGGTAVMGGEIYRGCAIPGLVGTYFFADHGFGRVFSLRYDGHSVSEFTERTLELDPPGDLDIRSISTFGIDSRGEIYLFDYADGELFQIVEDSTTHGDCNANGIADICEIADGSAPDLDHDGVIDFCSPTLVVDHLWLGKKAHIAFHGAQPSELVHYLLGLNGAGFTGLCITPTICLGLSQPLFYLVALPADASGTSKLDLFIPPSVPSFTLGLQCVLVRGPAGESSIVSNAFGAQVVLPPDGVE